MDASTNGYAGYGGRHDGHEHDSLDKVPKGWRHSIPRFIGFTAFLVIIVFWIWVFANRNSIAHPDEFDDPVFSDAAEAVCAPRQAAIAELQHPSAASGPEERSISVAQGTAELEQMLEELAALPLPTDPQGANGVGRWLEDYELFLDDRRAWAELLAEGRDEIFLVSGTDTPTGEGVRVTNLLRTFAEVNNMASCAPSPDVR